MPIRKHKNFLVFDFGASNGRGIVFGFDGKKSNMDILHRFENRPVYMAGTLYWDILRLYSELIIGIEKSFSEVKKIESLAVDAWGADFGFIGKNRRLVSNPIHYRDEQRQKDAPEVFKKITAEELFFLTGAFISPLFDLFHLYSLKINRYTEIEEGNIFLTIPDIFNYLLTGTACNEWTRLTTSIMYDQEKRNWSNKIFNAFGLSKEIFPKMVGPGSVIGKIKGDICPDIECKDVRVVAPVTHDTPSAVAGIPAHGKRNWAFISIGTWCTIGKETEFPMINKQVAESGYFNEGGAEYSNLLVKNIAGLWILQQCRTKWIKDAGENMPWDKITALSQKAEPFKAFINMDDPEFLKPTPDMPSSIREYCKKNNQQIPGSPGEIARCVYESLVLKFKHEAKSLSRLIGARIELFHLIGGGTQNDCLCQWAADAMGIHVLAGPVETASIGNFLMQLKASGEIKNLEEGRIISKNSSKTVEYVPQEVDKWDNAYQKYSKTFL